jgi:hypothetical protein
MEAIDVEVNKTRLWDNMPVGNKLIAAISLFAGAFTRDGQNRALSTLQSEIDKDVQNQKLEYERKGEKAKNAYAIASKFYTGEKERLAMAHAITNESLAAKAMELEAGIQPQKTKEAIEKFKLQLKLAAQNNTSKAYKDYLDVRKAELDLIGKKREIKDKENQLNIGSAAGEQLGRAKSETEARETNEILASYETAVSSIDKASDLVRQQSRLSKFNPFSTEWALLRAKGVESVLAYATLQGKANRLPVAEISENKKEMEKQFDEMWRRGTDTAIKYLDGLKEHSRTLMQNVLKGQQLGLPKSVRKTETPQVR